MADINQVYAGAIDQQDPDVVIAQIPGFWPWDAPRDIYLPDDIRDKIRKSNLDATATAGAVKVAYAGTTATERTAWLNERLTAINDRVAFIKARTDALLSRLQAMSTDSYNVFTKIVTTALALVPVIGSAATFAQNQVNTAQSLEQFKVQSLIQDYATDLGQLATIRKQLTAELAGTPTTVTGTDTTSNAATVIPIWYYFVGAGAVVIFFMWLKSRKPKRRKR